MTKDDKIKAYQRECREVEQRLGKALGYFWFKDDQKNFPGATEEDGVCVGEHVPVTIAAEAAAKIKKLKRIEAAAREYVENAPGMFCFCAVVTKEDPMCATCEFLDSLDLPSHGGRIRHKVKL